MIRPARRHELRSYFCHRLLLVTVALAGVTGSGFGCSSPPKATPTTARPAAGVWAQLRDTTWRRDNGWAGEAFVFYEDDAGNRKCLHQTYGSGIPVVNSAFAAVEPIDERTIRIDSVVYRYRQPNSLVADVETLHLQATEPVILGASGRVDAQKVRKKEFRIESLISSQL